MEAYWELNALICESGTVHFVLDSDDVRNLDVARPRVFFDRLIATKELALQCQGKVEISFHGYDDDPRELYEIDEVRAYVALLDQALPDLFFLGVELPPHLVGE